MLKLNKLEKQAITPARTRYDLCRQLCDCALQFETVWEEKEIEFDADLEDEAFIPGDAGLRHERGQNLIWFKRDRQIINKAELTRLERHFDACLAELSELERSKYVRPTVQSSICGLLGTAFMAGSVFAVTAVQPIVWLCVLLAIPGFLGWILPYFIYHRGVAKRTAEVTPFIDAKHEEIDKICEKGHSLL